MNLDAIRILTRLQFRQFFRQKNKGLIGKIVIVAYFWLLELLLFFMLREEGITDVPPLLISLVLLSFIVPDFILKLIFEHDQTVMDAFVKTRPISQSSWDRFLTLSQLWKPSNLTLPLSLVLACFLFLPFGWGLAVLLALYLFSVFGSFLVMLFKHRGNYPSEKRVSAKAGRFIRQGDGHHIFGIQSRSFLRSKRLKTGLLVLTIVFFLQFILHGADDNGPFGTLFLSYMILYAALGLSQWGFSIEANFFSGIWTKPLPIHRLLEDKFLFSAFLGGVTALVALPFCFWFEIPFYAPLVYALFNAGVGIPLILVDAYKCMPFDLFGKTFFNYQGSSSTFKASAFLVIIVVMVAPIVLPLILPDWLFYLILAVLGLAGCLFYRPYFRWVECQFLKNRYQYMEKYLSI